MLSEVLMKITIVTDETRAPNIELDDEAKALPSDELACLVQDAIMLLHTHLLTLESIQES
jgi:hypothetical protein